MPKLIVVFVLRDISSTPHCAAWTNQIPDSGTAVCTFFAFNTSSIISCRKAGRPVFHCAYGAPPPSPLSVCMQLTLLVTGCWAGYVSHQEQHTANTVHECCDLAHGKAYTFYPSKFCFVDTGNGARTFHAGAPASYMFPPPPPEPEPEPPPEPELEPEPEWQFTIVLTRDRLLGGAAALVAVLLMVLVYCLCRTCPRPRCQCPRCRLPCVCRRRQNNVLVQDQISLIHLLNEDLDNFQRWVKSMKRVHAEFVTQAQRIGYWKTVDPVQNAPAAIDVIQPKLSYKRQGCVW
eukprot:COSAG05_NODE_731_length_7667_cov_140.831792_13_plen_290_part_00